MAGEGKLTTMRQQETAHQEANAEPQQAEAAMRNRVAQPRRDKPIIIPAEERGKRRAGKALRMTVDCALGAVFVALMSTAMVREVAHEYLGMAAFALFIVHQLLNRRWWTGLARGRWNARRVLGTLVNVALATCMVGQAASALVLSKYALGWLPAIDGAWWARIVHMLCSYWGLALLGVHVGWHLTGIGRKLAKRGAILAWSWRMFAIALAAAGIWAFVDLNMGSYLLLRVRFAFVDPSTPLWLTATKYLLIASLFAVVGSTLNGALRRCSKRQTRL